MCRKLYLVNNSDKMGKSIVTGIMALILLISLLLIGITIASIITDGTSRIIKEENFKQMTNKAITEISAYIQIKEQKGRYNELNGERRIDKIILYISPLVSQKIDVSHLTIQLNNGETIRFLKYVGNAENLESYSIFNHPIWNSMNGNNFGFISIIDLDESLISYDIINDYSDNVYIIFRLPDDMTLAKHDQLIVTLFPSSGITRTTILKAPCSIQTIVDL
jgi:archaellin